MQDILMQKHFIISSKKLNDKNVQKNTDNTQVQL